MSLNTFGKKLLDLARITTIELGDYLVVQKNTDGDRFTRIMLWSDFLALIDGSGTETIREITNSTTQNAQDDYISADSGSPIAGINYSLLSSPSAVKRVTIKAEIDGGNVIIVLAGSDTIKGVVGNPVLTPDTSITLAPIQGGWSRS